MTETSATGTTTGLDDNMVSSSSQEPRTSTIAVQTPSKLLKDLIAGSSKISKEELRQLKEKVDSWHGNHQKFVIYEIFLVVPMPRKYHILYRDSILP